MKEENKNNFKLKRTLLIIVCVVESLVLLCCIGFAVFRHMLRDYTKEINYVQTVAVMETPLYREMKEKGELVEDDPEIINILLIGQDARKGQGTQRSDSMILCTINLYNDTLTMTSFMRDMYLEIPGYGYDKINAAYPVGGMEMLDQCLLKNFGIVVDYNIEVNFEGFMKAIDTIGGVDIELKQSEADYLNRWGNWDVDNSTAWTWELKAGMNHLTGEQALAYSRDRFSDGSSDYGRTERQRKVLTAVMNKCKTLSVNELDKLVKEILPNITTDMDAKQIEEYTMKLLPKLAKLEIQQLRIPADGTFSEDTENWRLIPNLDKNKELLAGAMQK